MDENFLFSGCFSADSTVKSGKNINISKLTFKTGRVFREFKEHFLQ